MDEPQKPKGSIEHLKRPPIAVEPGTLNYAHGRYMPPEPSVPVAFQVFLGIAAWIGSVAGYWFLMVNSQTAQGSAGLFGSLLLGALIALCVWLRISQKWKGFIPGVLIAFFLTCLVPIGIVGVVCFGTGRH